MEEAKQAMLRSPHPEDYWWMRLVKLSMFPMRRNVLFSSGCYSKILQIISERLHACLRGVGQRQRFWVTFVFHMGPARRQTADGSKKRDPCGSNSGALEEQREKAWEGGRAVGPSES